MENKEMKDASLETQFQKLLSVPLELTIEKVKAKGKDPQYIIQTMWGMSPEVQVAMFSAVGDYCRKIISKERTAAKAERTFTQKELNEVLSTVAVCDMVVNTQAPILWKDLQMQAVAMQQAEQEKNPKKSALVVVGKLGSTK